MERSDWGRRKNIQTEKTETSYPMENFKGQVPFLLFFAYFSCDFFFFFFFGENKRGMTLEDIIIEDIQTMKNIRDWENSLEE